jgi:hypothetical protein
MRHPAESELALFSGRDLGLWSRWRVGRHVARCQDCRAALREFEAVRVGVQEFGSDLPGDLNWNRMAGEMTGNIRVGLAAGEAIARYDRVSAKVRPQRLGWHAAAVLAGACVVFVAVFWLYLPQQQADRLTSAFERIRGDRIGTLVKGHAQMAPDEVVLEASRSSIQVRENGGTLSLMHPRSDGVTISVNMQGSAGARYVDSDTGQVTINRVYYAQQ